MLRIVLVEPREAGNVGAVARAMKNFGFTDLWIAGDYPILAPQAVWWASGAEDVVDGARRVPSLQDAIADAHVAVATTSMRGRTSPPDLSPAGAADLYRGLSSAQTFALVFGREDSGLTREELALCQRTVSIPTNPSFPTMNLAQAVCVFSYLFSPIEPAATARPLASTGTIERLHQRARALLLEAGFLNESNPDSVYEELRALAGRAAVDEREATILLGVVRQLEWRLRQE